MQVLPALELLRVLSQHRARHLVDALLLKLVLHPVHLLPHHLAQVEGGLRERVDVLLLRVDFRKAEAYEVAEVLRAQEGLEDGRVEALAALQLCEAEELLVVSLLLRREVDVLDEEAVDALHHRQPVGTHQRRAAGVAHHGAQVDEVRVVVQVDQLLLPDLVLRQEVVVAVLARRNRPAAVSAEHGAQRLVEGEQLVLAQRVELAKGGEAMQDASVEAKHEVDRAVLVVARARQFDCRALRPRHRLQRLCVDRRRHRPREGEAGVSVERLLLLVVAKRLGVLPLIVGHRDAALSQVVREEAKVRRTAVPVKVEQQVAVCERPPHAGAVDEELEQEAAHRDGGGGELRLRPQADGALTVECRLADLAQEGVEVGLKVASVARQLRRHRARAAAAVDEEVPLQVERRGREAHVVQRANLEVVDLAPEVVEHPPRRVGVRAHVVRLVLLHVLRVAVAALEQQEARQLVEGLPAHEGEARGEWVVVEKAALVQHLEGGEVRVDAARDEHPLRRHVVQQVLVQHVFALVQHILEHVNLEHAGEEGGDGVVVGVALVKVGGLGEEQQW
mmetsp:Transcript_17265/g.55253  ORF Transcript_17265/g.55253 Transcript_17265/m.55253 type:complete len:562 (-) Transcript_17265:157-1842(-)